MLNICLISPNYIIRDEFGEPLDPPLGIALIAASLKEKYNVKIIDADTLNLNFNDILKELNEFKAHIIGISCNYSPLHNAAINLAKFIKKNYSPQTKIIVGGNHASALAEYLLKSSQGSIDYIALGEGEEILPKLLNALENNLDLSNLKGLVYYKDNILINTGKAFISNNLNSLSMPAYSLLPMEKYQRYNIISMRGCPYNCAYCSSKIISGYKVRYREAERVIEEIKFLLDNYGHKHFWFSDDTFTSNINYNLKLLKKIKENNLKITWSCLTRVNVVTEELLSNMKETGCSYISYGIESGNQDILNKMGKKINLQEIKETIKLTHKLGIKQYGFFIIGYPGENKKTVQDTFNLIKELKLDGAAFNILIPLPGTPLMDYLLKNNFLALDEIKWDYLFARSIKGEHFDYSARLASRWCELSPKEIIQFCDEGTKMFKK